MAVVRVGACGRVHRLRNASGAFWFGALIELGSVDRAGVLDLVLQIENGADELLGARWAAWDVDIDRDKAIDALHHGVGIEDTAAAGACTHRDAPLGFGHLQPDALHDWQHLHYDATGHDHQIALSRCESHDFAAEARQVMSASRCTHQFDTAASGGERHGPQAVRTRPVGGRVDAGPNNTFA